MKGKIFNAQEVQAMLSGSKVMFREVCLFQPTNELALDALLRLYKPYEVGQKIFVKESFFGCPIYRKDAIFPARYMKQEHSRLTLMIKEIRVERLQEISEEDCWKEGMEEFIDSQEDLEVCEMTKKLGFCIDDITPTFALAWNATHKKPEEKFEASPWVWVISFEVV